MTDDAERADAVPLASSADSTPHPQSGRTYSGLVKNGDGPNTYTGIVILFGAAVDDYCSPESIQRQFDEGVNAGTPAHGELDGEPILVTRVEAEIMP